MKSKVEIHYRKHHEIDFNKWDKCIQSSVNGIVYAFSWYLNVVCNEWEALIQGDYETVMPLTKGKKYQVNYLYQPFFTQQLGIFSTRTIDKYKVEGFLNVIPEKYKYIEINLNKFNLLTSEHFDPKNNITYELDLIDNYENIFRKYGKNNIRNIQKAIRFGISIKVEQLSLEIKEFITKWCKIPGINSKRLEILFDLIKAGQSNGNLKIYGAYNNTMELCAIGVFVFSMQKACFILSVASTTGIKNRAMFLLIDDFIKDHSNENLILDFEGSNIEGIARFYGGFGANPFNYQTIKINRLPFPFRLLKN
ncbi:MAG: hypothetical protein U0W24_06645 [Bacteroidales bacterium]